MTARSRPGEVGDNRREREKAQAAKLLPRAALVLREPCGARRGLGGGQADEGTSRPARPSFPFLPVRLP